MQLSRRDTLALGGAATAAAALPGFAWATEEDNGLAEAIEAFTGGAEVTEGGVDIIAPEIAENGNTVPVEVEAEGAAAILLLATGNPNAGVAQFNFGKLSASSAAKTRIRLARTQDVIALAKMSDGSISRASQTVKVTIGGCGG